MPKSHLDHQVEVVLTPNLKHHAKLICLECNGLWLQWLSREDTSTLTGKQQPKKKQKPKITDWTNITIKERQHYQSFQPHTQRKNTQLIGDRLALRGRSQYNGNPIGNIPLTTLKQILATKIDNPSDRQFIEQHISMRSGPEPGPSVVIQSKSACVLGRGFRIPDDIV